MIQINSEFIPAKLLLQEMKDRLGAIDQEIAPYQIKVLLEDFVGVSPSTIRFSADLDVSREITEKILDLIEKIEQGIPLGRALGYRDFWKDRFILSKDTLEPRPDTETLIEEVLKSYKGSPPSRILDLGTGTGCILLSLLREFPAAEGIGVDISSGACKTAQENAENLGMENRARFLCGNWTDPLGESEKFDLIVSNPPYIPTAEITNLDQIVQKYDPIMALDGGEDGLMPYTNLLPTLKKYLEAGGRIFLEFGINQARDITRLAEDSNATLIRVTKDIGGVERVVEISYGDK
ncbi:MAG: peptide chain release factor N(5)-glutamine methyltransferase [Pseudobdellovibrionaceae bacterium]|jgi:release factor glutamine methyltransferase|nr:peptide chain release factor N(5)-glutamine methyltransferase [Pseudobdellovibrionaceae bacterium]